MSEEDFYIGRTMPRNRELMRVFKDVELVEELGSGMRRILEAYDRSVFEITPSFVVVTFPYASDFERDENGDSDRTAIGNTKRGTENDAVGVNGVNGVNGVSQNEVLNMMKNEPNITLKLLSEKMGIPRRTLDRIVLELKNKNVIERVGTSRSGYWKIID